MKYLITFYIFFQIIDAFSQYRVVKLLGFPPQISAIPWFANILIISAGIFLTFPSVFKNIENFISRKTIFALAFCFVFISICNQFNDANLSDTFKQFLSIFMPFLATGFFIYAYKRYKILREFIFYIPHISIFASIANGLAYAIFGDPPVNSLTILIPSLYISFNTKRYVLFFISIFLILFSFKKSLILALIFSTIFLMTYIFFTRLLPLLINKLQIKKNVFPVVILSISALPLIYYGLFFGDNSKILENLSILIESFDLIFSYDLTSEDNPLYLPLYYLSSGRSVEYLLLWDTFKSSLPMSIIFGVGPNPTFETTTLSGADYALQSIHSSLLLIFYSTGIFGITIYNFFIYRILKISNISGKLLIIGWLTYGIFNSIQFDFIFAISLSLVIIKNISRIEVKEKNEQIISTIS